MGAQIAQPDVEPVTLTEAKAHLRVTASDDDTYISSLIKVARERAEDYTGRLIVSRAVTYTLDSFPVEVVLPHPPVQSLTSIQYVDGDGATQSFTDTQTDFSNDFYPLVKPAYNESWPSTRAQYGAVTITYVAGYGSSADSPDTSSQIPEAIRQAILLMVGTMYEYREELVTGANTQQIDLTAQRLLDPYRVRHFV